MKAAQSAACTVRATGIRARSSLLGCVLILWSLVGIWRCTSAESPAASETPGLPPVRVYLLAGQSNAEGYCNTRHYREGREPFPDFLKEQRQIRYWWGTDLSPGGSNQWTILQVTDSGRFGPEIGFGHELIRLVPTNSSDIAIIKFASGGTGIARSRDYTDYIPSLTNFQDHGRNWHPPSDGQPPGNLYAQLLVQVRRALDALNQTGRRAELAGFLWMQGEHEAGISRKMANDYGRLLTEFIQSVRHDLNAPSLPVVVGEINSHTWAFGEIARTEQREACLRLLGVTLIPTVDLPRIPGDAAHFTTDGMLTLGTRFALALQTTPTTPPLTPPSLEGIPSADK